MSAAQTLGSHDRGLGQQTSPTPEAPFVWFEEVNFSGTPHRVEPGAYADERIPSEALEAAGLPPTGDFEVVRSFCCNDRMGSVRIYPGARAVLWQNGAFGTEPDLPPPFPQQFSGSRKLEVTRDIADLRNYGMHNEVSSFIVFPPSSSGGGNGSGDGSGNGSGDGGGGNGGGSEIEAGFSVPQMAMLVGGLGLAGTAAWRAMSDE